jgi:hypothetical protein
MTGMFCAVGSAETFLGMLMLSKSGPLSARVWSYSIINNGQDVATAAQITSLRFTQSGGGACSLAPVVGTASVDGGAAQSLPVQLGDMAPDSRIPVDITIDFSSCPIGARFAVTIIIQGGIELALGEAQPQPVSGSGPAPALGYFRTAWTDERRFTPRSKT